MKQLSTALADHLNGDVTTLAHCWKLTRRDGVEMGFTDHDVAFDYDGLVYEAQTGFTPTAIETSATLAIDNLEIDGMLNATSINEEEVLAGRYDFAQVELFMVNYADLSQGRLMLRTGWLGQVTTRQGQFVAEVRGLTQSLTQSVGELYSPTCRAALGDSRCAVDLAPYTFTGTISAVDSRSRFSDDARTQDAGYFANGTVQFTSGANVGLHMEVKQFSGGVFTLSLPLPYVVQVGDAYTAIAGCDKRFATCMARFANAINFRGEPHVPGLDAILQTASTRS